VKGLVSKDHVALITMIGAQITIGEYSPLSERNSLLLWFLYIFFRFILIFFFEIKN